MYLPIQEQRANDDLHSNTRFHYTGFSLFLKHIKCLYTHNEQSAVWYVQVCNRGRSFKTQCEHCEQVCPHIITMFGNMKEKVAYPELRRKEGMGRERALGERRE